MPNVEKLINALTCIMNDDMLYPCIYGKEPYKCPYYVADDEEGGLWHCLRQDCLADVIATLKDQRETIKRLLESAQILSDALEERGEDDA